jgi:hypothetical protein
MRRQIWEATTIILLVVPLFADARAPRSHAAKAEFQRRNPCPSTGKTRGACPGWVKDHVMPLCAGGPDHPSNMQWQTVADAKIKDRDERRMCKELPSP